VFGAPRVTDDVDVDMDRQVEQFVDKYITCDSELAGALSESSDLGLADGDTLSASKGIDVKKQMHRHRATCLKYSGPKNKICRFHFPLPPMRQTTVMRVLSDEECLELHLVEVRQLKSYSFY